MRQLTFLLLVLLVYGTTLGDEGTKAQVRETWENRSAFWKECEVTWSVKIEVQPEVFSECSFNLLLSNDRLRLVENGIDKGAPVVPGAVTNIWLRTVRTDDGLRSRDVTYRREPTSSIWVAKKSEDAANSVLKSVHRNQRVASLLISLRPFTERFHGFSLDRATCKTDAGGRVILPDSESDQQLTLEPKLYRVVGWEAPLGKPRLRTKFIYNSDDANSGLLPDAWTNTCLDRNQVPESTETCRIESANLKPVFDRNAFDEIMPRVQGG